jgi:hypothetical protein
MVVDVLVFLQKPAFTSVVFRPWQTTSSKQSVHVDFEFSKVYDF